MSLNVRGAIGSENLMSWVNQVDQSVGSSHSQLNDNALSSKLLNTREPPILNSIISPQVPIQQTIQPSSIRSNLISSSHPSNSSHQSVSGIMSLNVLPF